jgi:hypothetical protein
MSSRDEVRRVIGYVLIGWGTFSIFGSALNFRNITEYAGQIIFLHQWVPSSSISVWDGAITFTTLLDGIVALIAGITILRRPTLILNAVCVVTVAALFMALIRTWSYTVAPWRQGVSSTLEWVRLVVANYPSFAVGIMAMIALRRSRLFERADAEPGPACRQCGYSLFGLSEPRCPECGRAYTLDEFYRLPPV